MIVRHLEDIVGTDHDIQTPTWNSRRLLLKDANMGFSMHDTLIHAGTETEMCYANHLEAVYCVEGTGSIKNLEDGSEYEIRPGTLYALTNHERHILIGKTQMRMICVFNPPVTGREVHDETGAYPAELEVST
ncbi:MAG: ectoine synthase [Acidobacteria bacterium]|nr:ectoine synthase [Acidobacteriota bacterium]MCB9397963.1 ectoine synthase [Acidobacteriota bacterium]